MTECVCVFKRNRPHLNLNTIIYQAPFIMNIGFITITVVGQLPETSVIQNAPYQKSIIVHTLCIILENHFENQRFSYQMKQMEHGYVSIIISNYV